VFTSSILLKLKVHKVKGSNVEVIKRYRIIPYQELVAVLKDDGEAFLEDSDRELKRGTVWKAARRLSQLVGRRVRAGRAFLRFPDGTLIEGWSFSVEE
jgi:hypothetical protein